MLVSAQLSSAVGRFETPRSREHYELIRGAAHMSPFTHPERVAHIIRKHLGRVQRLVPFLARQRCKTTRITLISHVCYLPGYLDAG
jgi:hypothetical protein